MKTWRIQPCTFKTLAALYGMTEKVLRTQLKPFQHKIGKKLGHTYTVKQLLIIFDEYCTPANIDIIYPEPIMIRKRGNTIRAIKTAQDLEGLII